MYHWSYHSIETADTELYFRCGLMKAIPLTPLHTTASAGRPDRSEHVEHGDVTLAPFLIHHMPNKYVKEGTQLVDKFHLTADMLLHWLSMCQTE